MLTILGGRHRHINNVIKEVESLKNKYVLSPIATMWTPTTSSNITSQSSFCPSPPIHPNFFILKPPPVLIPPILSPPMYPNFFKIESAPILFPPVSPRPFQEIPLNLESSPVQEIQLSLPVHPDPRTSESLFTLSLSPFSFLVIRNNKLEKKIENKGGGIEFCKSEKLNKKMKADNDRMKLIEK